MDEDNFLSLQKSRNFETSHEPNIDYFNTRIILDAETYDQSTLSNLKIKKLYLGYITIINDQIFFY